MRSTTVLLAVSACVTSALGATYRVQDRFIGDSFLSGFRFDNIRDPTEGRVNYVDQATARAKNLTFTTPDTFILRADSFTTLTPGGPGRDSVRLVSKTAYRRHVAVFDIRHMPQGCGSWPAVWELTTGGWPQGGEIDIGVNDIEPNQMTLHTDAGCTMPPAGPSRPMTGSTLLNNCDVAATGNSGCGVHDNQPNNYGKSFNANRGGFYALERTDTAIKLWFFARGNPSTPADILNHSDTVNPDAWGTPVATFVNQSCDLVRHFNDHNIVINLTFCGQWAGLPEFYNVRGGCPGTCNDFVERNPSAFNDAFFDFASALVYV